LYISLATPTVGNNETSTSLEAATFLFIIADIFGDGFPWLPSAGGAAACDNGPAGSIRPGEETKETDQGIR
jgi:hypothetical protein